MLKEIKHQFLAYRNGIVADALRRAGFPHKIIFGLQLPQISEIAKLQMKSEELADALWSDRNVRESRLLACYLYPEDVITQEKAMLLARDVQTMEEGDILTFRLLRRLPFAKELKERLINEDPESNVIKAMERFEI